MHRYNNIIIIESKLKSVNKFVANTLKTIWNVSNRLSNTLAIDLPTILSQFFVTIKIVCIVKQHLVFLKIVTVMVTVIVLSL